jgi:hypothetical protein
MTIFLLFPWRRDASFGASLRVREVAWAFKMPTFARAEWITHEIHGPGLPLPAHTNEDFGQNSNYHLLPAIRHHAAFANSNK